MNILFCNYEYPPLGGGGGVMNALLAEELAKRHRVTVLTSQALGLAAESVVNGVHVVRVPVFFRKEEATANLLSMHAFIVQGIRAGRRLVRQRKFDVINTHFVLPSGPVGDALARLANLPNVLTLHGGDLYDPSKFTSPHRHTVTRAWVRWLLHQADAITANSANTLENARKYFTPAVGGTAIPLGIARPQPGRAQRADYDIAEDEFVLVTVGRLVRRKAIDQLLSMLGALRGKKVRLLVVGGGPEEELLKETAQRLRLGEQVKFLGYVEEAEKFRLLEMSDLYVSTTQHEGFCLAFLEAMSKSLPVVTYDHGGHTDYLRDGQNGFLVPLNNLELFTQRVKLLMENVALRRKMGVANLQRVEEFYIDTCAARYEEIFKQVVERRQPVRQVGVFREPKITID